MNQNSGISTISDSQLAANRRNAQKSTGPRSPGGKALVSLNAVKHGFLAKQLLLRSRESPSELRAFASRFYADLCPCGATEELLVQEIISSSWRLRRFRTAESAHIGLRVARAGRAAPEPAVQWALWRSAPDPVHSMSQSSIGCFLLLEALRAVRNAFESEGELTDDAVDSFLAGARPSPLSTRLRNLRAWFLRNPDHLDPSSLRNEHRRQTLEFLETESARLTLKFEQCEEREDSEQADLESAALIPGAEDLDRFLRYEAALARQCDRALIQLERLQRRRNGDDVPPPVTVQISPRP